MSAAWTSIALVLFLPAAAGCKTGDPRPPTFADFQKAFEEDAAHTNFDAQVAIFAAAQLSHHELVSISKRRNSEELIGAGIQAPLADPLGRLLLIRATELSPGEPIVWAALAYRDMEALQNSVVGVEAVAQELKLALDKWRLFQPSNSAPLYLESTFESLRTNFPSAELLLMEADRKRDFDTLSLPIKKCVIQAMESVGRSKYTARLLAMGQAVGVVSWSKLSKSILAVNSKDQEVIRGCIHLGARIGSGKSFLEQLIGDSMQAKALDKVEDADVALEKAKIAERKALIKRAIAYDSSLRRRRISETRWIRFFDMCFNKGELAALESVAADNNETFLS